MVMNVNRDDKILVKDFRAIPDNILFYHHDYYQIYENHFLKPILHRSTLLKVIMLKQIVIRL